MRTISAALFAFPIVVVSIFIPGGHAQTCHLRELDLCSATLLLFNQNPSGVATTDAELDKQCAFLGEAQQCFANFTRRCATPLQRELVAFASEGSGQLFKEFCSRSSKIRKDYLRHAPCLGQTQADQKRCLNDVQLGLERISTVRFADRVSTACCTYARYVQCTTAAVERKCGRDAVEFGQLLVRMAAANLPDTLCAGYSYSTGSSATGTPSSGNGATTATSASGISGKSAGKAGKGNLSTSGVGSTSASGGNPLCDKLLPPRGSKPSGKSNSVLSRLFSAYLGN